MTIQEKLNKTLLTSKHGDVIVAVPPSMDVEDAIDFLPIAREIVSNSIVPYFFHGVDFCFVFGLHEKFTEPAYVDSFIKKCEDFEDMSIHQI